MRLATIVCLLAAGAPANESDPATIVDSGSTNRAGFRIAVDRAGVAEITATRKRPGANEAQPGPIRKMLPQALADAFYADLKAARPLASLPAIHCAKSASFGSALTVGFDREETPDLSCGDGGNRAMRDLIRDTRQIAALMQAD